MQVETIIIYLICYFTLLFVIFFLINLFTRKEPKLKKIKEYPKVSIIIPAYNEEENIGIALDSLLKVNYPKDKLEIIVIDDGSTDNTYKIAKSFNKVKVFKKERGGKAKAVNFGVKRASGDLIMVLDADCVLPKNSLELMARYFNDKQTMAVVPSLKVFKAKNWLERVQQIEYVLSSFFRKILWSMSAMYVVPGATLYRANFLRLNKFDEGNPTEDLEMGLRIKYQGYEIAHATEAHVFTKVPETIFGLLKQRVRWTWGMLYNFKKYGFLFSFKYGDLGAFILPMLLAGIAISFLFITLVVSLTLRDFLHWFWLSSQIGFDLNYMITTFDIVRFLETLLDPITFLSLTLLSFGIIFYSLSIRELEEKPNPIYLIYVSIYGWLLLFFNFFATILFLIRKKPKW
jgi:cellulose synthase/poly-beta-1,6-N-acetylglucosamine synthase-like glycosyltransferase